MQKKSIYIKQVQIPNPLDAQHKQKQSEQSQKASASLEKCACNININGKKFNIDAPALFFDEYPNGTRVNITRNLNATEIKNACKPVCREVSKALGKDPSNESHKIKNAIIASTGVTLLITYGLYRIIKTKSCAQHHDKKSAHRI